jgi:hypothetical protein
MKNIYLLPTEKASRLGYLTKKGKEVFNDLRLFDTLMPNILDSENQHIYITDNSDIKDCWVLNIHINELYFLKGYYGIQPIAKKIILTTDPYLISDGIQAIDEDFLQWFVNNSSCEYVEVKKGKLQTNDDGQKYGFPDMSLYKIIIPQEEPKQEIVGYRLKPSIDRMMVDGILKNAMPIWNDEDKSVYFIRGHVAGSLVAKMKELQVLDLWFNPIYESEEVNSDWAKEHHLEYYKKEGSMADKPKQEKIEEAAEKYVEDFDLSFYDTVEEIPVKEIAKNDFISGAKWMEKRMYSEEEVKLLLDKVFHMYASSHILDAKEWFEKNKKK